MELDIRWKQRFENFEKAYLLLREIIRDKTIDSTFLNEIIAKRFEMTYELSWKTFKDFLEYEGVLLDYISPRKVYKACFENGIFEAASIEWEVFNKMIETRNSLSHEYSFERLQESVKLIVSDYVNELEKQYQFFKGKNNG